MKIAFVTPHATPPGTLNGPHRGPRLVPLAAAMAEAGHDVTMYARKDSSGLPSAMTLSAHLRIEHVEAGPAEWLPPDELVGHVRPFGDYLARRWEENPPDVVHAYSWPSGLAAFAATCDRGIPVVQTFHSLTSPAGRSRFWQPREPLARTRLKVSLARSVRAVLARSSEEMRQLMLLGVPRTSVKIVPWGVDISHFAPDGPAASRNGRPRLLTFLPPAGQPGADVILRALVDIPGAELVIVGGPTDGQRSRGQGSRGQGSRGQAPAVKMHRELSRLVAKLKVSSRVTYLPDVAWEDLPALLRSADLYVSAEGDGVFDSMALQAMSCGTPVAAPAVGFYPDAVIDGTTGLLVPPGEPAAVARRIRHLLASPLQLEAFGIAAADRAKSRYSWDRIGREAVHAYEQCLPALTAEPGPAEEDLEFAELAAS